MPINHNTNKRSNICSCFNRYKKNDFDRLKLDLMLTESVLRIKIRVLTNKQVLKCLSSVSVTFMKN